MVRNWNKGKKEGTVIKHDEEMLRNQVQRNSVALFFSKTKENETWVPLIEKAYAKAHGDYNAVSKLLIPINFPLISGR